MGLLKDMFLAMATGGVSLIGKAFEGGDKEEAATTEGFGPPPAQASQASADIQGPPLPNQLLQPGAGMNEVMGAVLTRKRKRDEFMGNPLNRLGATFGLTSGPAEFTAAELFGKEDLTEAEQNNMYMANQMLGSQQDSYLGGIGGFAASAPGNLMRSIF